jgi:hypothetical protein
MSYISISLKNDKRKNELTLSPQVSKSHMRTQSDSLDIFQNYNMY